MNFTAGNHLSTPRDIASHQLKLRTLDIYISVYQPIIHDFFFFSFRTMRLWRRQKKNTIRTSSLASGCVRWWNKRRGVVMSRFSALHHPPIKTKQCHGQVLLYHLCSMLKLSVVCFSWSIGVVMFVHCEKTPTCASSGSCWKAPWNMYSLTNLTPFMNTTSCYVGNICFLSKAPPIV